MVNGLQILLKMVFIWIFSGIKRALSRTASSPKMTVLREFLKNQSFIFLNLGIRKNIFCTVLCVDGIFSDLFHLGYSKNLTLNNMVLFGNKFLQIWQLLRLIDFLKAYSKSLRKKYLYGDFEDCVASKIIEFFLSQFFNRIFFEKLTSSHTISEL